MDWLQNRNVKFAVGCTVLFLLVRWLLTGDLLLAAAALGPPAEGETKSLASVWSVVWPIFFESMGWVGGSLIVWSIGVWGWLADLFAGGSKPAAKLSVNDAAQDLLRAVATNDTAAIAAYAKRIREPYARSEVSQALADGDFAKARALLAELEGLTAAQAKEER